MLKEQLREKILTKSAKVTVIGLGYVGLPLALEIAETGYDVLGIDISKPKLEKLNNGKSYVIDIPDDKVKKLINYKFRVSDDFSLISQSDVIIICVPTPLNKTKDPDVTILTSVISEIVNYITQGTLIILESTTYPGTTEELIKFEIENQRNIQAGEDFFLCFSPERIDPGNKHYQVKNTPKVIGGITPVCTELGMLLYKTFIDHVVVASSTKVAEMVKLLENTFRSVNIALVNELAVMCKRMGINVWEVIDAASTKPFGFMPFYPGPGIGGHCIPLDPMYLSWKAKMYDFYSKFIDIASDINGNMPRFVIQEIADILNEQEKPIKNSKILLIGMAYKKDIDDLRESPALEVYGLLLEKGAEVTYHDPYVDSFEFHDTIVNSLPLTEKFIQEQDLVVILTDHSSIDYQFIIDNAKSIYDTRNVTKNFKHNERINLLGGQKHSKHLNELINKEIAASKV